MRIFLDSATVPESLFFFIQIFQYPLTGADLEEFRKDWARVPK